MRIIVLPAARDDPRDIWRFGVITWGEAQADRYSDTLDAAINGLDVLPYRGPAADEVSQGLRRLVVRSHVVFYRVEGEAVRVVRVLHGSRDAGRWVG